MTLEPMEEFEADVRSDPSPERVRPDTVADHDRPRSIGRRSGEDWFGLLGSMAASFALVWLLYFQVLPFSGKVGFVICWYMMFVAFYAGITSLTQPRPLITDRLASAAVHGGAGIVALAVGASVIYVFYKGWPALHHLNFYTHDMTGASLLSPLDQGGIEHAIIGSAIELGLAVVVSLPLGLLTAVYLTEVGGRLAVPVRTVIEAMTALPDLVAGLFIYVIVEIPLHDHPAFAVSLALAITMIPIIARSSEVVLRSVPSGLREASAALGALQWRTTLGVVIPTARAGLGTALILGMARGVGEAAPVIILATPSSYSHLDPFHGPMNSLPFFIYHALRSPASPTIVARGFGAAAVLLTFILILFVIIRVLARERRITR